MDVTFRGMAPVTAAIP